jgi:hypothetical protein
LEFRSNNLVAEWENARKSYSWTADLSNFPYRENYKGYFNRFIDGKNITSFENRFRASLKTKHDFVVAGEVYYWKNHIYDNCNQKTNALLELLSKKENWETFVYNLVGLATFPTLENMNAFREACGQPYGFASPVTFLSFYSPSDYPMVDRRIGLWWNAYKAEHGRESAPEFIRIKGKPLELNEQNWQAYLEWTTFCGKYAMMLNCWTKMIWITRDVEMAVWQANNKPLPSVRAILACLEKKEMIAKQRKEIAEKEQRAKQRMKDAEMEEERRREKEEYQKKIKRIRESEIL